jgi:hypothetical protein
MARGAYKAKAKGKGKKFDRLLEPQSTKEEITVDLAIKGFDRWVRYLDEKWGVDRLIQLVEPEVAHRYGQALGKLNEAINAVDAAQARHCADDCIRGMVKMDELATAAGAAGADPSYWEFEVDGVRAAILADQDAWPKVKADRPDLELITLHEVGVHYAHWRKTKLGEMTAAVKTEFPGAQVTSMSLPNAQPEDPIPF